MNETCEICEIDLVNYDPQYCCSGHECGCMGQPNNPPVCSSKCYDILLKMWDTDTYSRENNGGPENK